MAKNIGAPKLAFELLDFEKIQIERSWLKQFLSRHNIAIKTPESLEAARNKYCHSQILIDFYTNFISNIPQNGNVIFNADETASTFNDKGKVESVKREKNQLNIQKKLIIILQLFAVLMLLVQKY